MKMKKKGKRQKRNKEKREREREKGRNLQRSGKARGAVALAGNVVATTSVPASALLGAVLPVAVVRALLVAVRAGPASSAGAFAVVGIAAGSVVAEAVLQTVLAPLAARTICVLVLHDYIGKHIEQAVRIESEFYKKITSFFLSFCHLERTNCSKDLYSLDRALVFVE